MAGVPRVKEGMVSGETGWAGAAPEEPEELCEGAGILSWEGRQQAVEGWKRWQ